MSEIKHDISINTPRETIYQALTTAQGLKSWFTAQVKGSGEVGTDWELSFTNQPYFCWRILAAESPQHVAWKCLEGPGNSPGTEVEFNLKSVSKDQTTLTISHRGWTKDDPKFAKCVEIWRTLMDHLRRSCEAGIKEPAYQ